MGWHRKVIDIVFPQRASTQTWMFLTLALLVTFSIFCVALYVLFMHGSQVQNAAGTAYMAQASHVARVLDTADSDSAQAIAAHLLSDALQLHIAVTFGDSVRLRTHPLGFETSIEETEWPQLIQQLQSGSHAFESRKSQAGGNRILLTAPLPVSGYTVFIEQQESPLHVEARRSRWALLFGMIMALLMAMVSSWVMADKVTAPLSAIGRSAKDIIAGKLDTPIRVDTRSAEIQDLAAHLDRMTTSYREKIQELERLAQVQNEFIGNVSHEVRNPIFAISGYLEALGAQDLSQERREGFAAKGLVNLARLGNLFESLIEIARLEVREDWIKPTPFNVAELLEEVADELHGKADEKGITLRMEGDTVWAFADRDQIHRVLINLISNAIVYSDKGYVLCRYAYLSNNQVRFEVADQGRGISPRHHKRIFERFYRVDPDRSRHSGGVGLGLSIVKQILQAHQASIHLKSELGQGSRFWFDLPSASPPESAS